MTFDDAVLRWSRLYWRCRMRLEDALGGALIWDELDRNEAARLLGGVVSVTRVAETVIVTTTTVTVEEKATVAELPPVNSESPKEP